VYVRVLLCSCVVAMTKAVVVFFMMESTTSAINKDMGFDIVKEPKITWILLNI